MIWESNPLFNAYFSTRRLPAVRLSVRHGARSNAEAEELNLFAYSVPFTESLERR
jgi:hypothetical protein